MRTEGGQDGEKIRAAGAIVDRLKESGFEAYFVGGCVQDYLRDVIPADYDIVTSALPDQVIDAFDRTVAVGARFGVVVVMDGDYSFEVATFRSDDAYEDGRRPSRIHYSSARGTFSGEILRSMACSWMQKRERSLIMWMAVPTSPRESSGPLVILRSASEKTI